MKKILLIILIIIAFSSQGLSLPIVDSIYENIRGQALKSLSDTFNRKVTVKSASGIIAGQIVLDDVYVGDELYFKKFIINFNPVEYAAKRCDIMPAISKINVVGGFVKAERDSHGRFNLSDILKQGEGGGPPFKAKIVFQDIDIYYHDPSAIGSKKFLRGAGEANLTKSPKINFLLKAQTERQGAINIKGNVDAEKYSCDLKVEVSKERLANIDFGGSGNISYRDKALKIQECAIQAYNGKIEVKGEISFKRKNPALNISGKTKGIDLSSVANNAPGISGGINSDFKIFGDINSFSSEIEGSFKKAQLWGQPIETFDAKLGYKDGAIKFDRIRIAGETSEYFGSGSISKERDFSFQSFANSIKLKGHGPFGPMQTVVKNFSGTLGFKLDDKFMSAPIRNLTAWGSVEIVDCSVGEQKIACGSGEIFLDRGIIKAKNARIKQGETTVYIAGETGIGIDTDLRLSGKSARLEDLKIISMFLPREAKNPTGAIDFDLSLFGRLSKLDSLQDILDLGISIEARSDKINIAEININKALVSLSVKDEAVTLRNLYVKSDKSEISGYFYKNEEEEIKTRLIGNIDADDVEQLIPYYGEFDGKGYVDFWASGDWDNPRAGMVFDLRDLRFNKIYFDSIDGEIKRQNNIVSFAKPLNAVKGENQFIISGLLDLDENLEESAINANIAIKKGKADQILIMALDGYDGISKLLKPVFLSRISADPFEFNLPLSETLYKKNGSNPQFYEKWDSFVKALENYKKMLKPPYVERIFGDINGSVRIKGKISSPQYSGYVEINDGRYSNYKFNKLSAAISASMESIEVKPLKIEKANGKTEISGTYNFRTKTIGAKAAALDMPIDFLQTFVPRDFEGRVDAGAKLEGAIDSPSASLWFKTSKIKLQDMEYAQAQGLASYSGKKMLLEKLVLDDGHDKSFLYGAIDLNLDLDLSATIEGRSLGLINLFNDEIKWVEGCASGDLRLIKKGNGVMAYGRLKASDAILRIKQIGAELGQGEISLSAQGDKIEINKLSGYLYGKKDAPKPIALSGYLSLSGGETAVRLSDGFYEIDAPHLYRGEITTSDLIFYGDKKEYALSGKARLSNGTFYLPAPGPQSGGTNDSPQIALDLKIEIPKDVYISAGDVNTINLSNVLMNLEMMSEKLNISGTLASPDLDGEIMFNRGTISIFNRDFVLLSPSRQKEFFPYRQEESDYNYAKFSGGTLPKLNLTALVEVEDIDASQKAQDGTATGSEQSRTIAAKKQIYVISKIAGTPMSAEKGKTISIQFNAFEKDLTTVPPAYKAANYTEDSIRVLLLPDFVKSAVGVNKGNALDSNAVVADYLNSRLQTFVFRGIERQLEKTFGLDSLTLDYNFGQDLRRAIGAKDVGPAQSQALGIGFVKGFFDRLYISVKYSQLMEQASAQANQTYLNYQLTYRLTPALSISYYREPISIYDIASGYAKTSLQIGRSF